MASNKAKKIELLDFKKANPKVVLGLLAILAFVIIGGVIAVQTSGFLGQNQDTRSRASCISCPAGFCPDGWSYGSDSCAFHRSCANRATEACAAHQKKVTPTPRRGGSRPY